MDAHRELLALHRKLTKSEHDVNQHNWNTHGSEVFCPAIAVTIALLGIVSAPYLPREASIGILITAAIIFLASPLPIYRIHRTRKTLAAARLTALTNYRAALHRTLDSKGYKGEYLSENELSENEHRLLANKNGSMERLTVKAMTDGMLITSEAVALTTV